MSGSVWIRVRPSSKGNRYAVIYRRGGRDYRQIHAGTFRTKALAEARLKVVEVELAYGRDPQVALTPEPSKPTVRRKFSDWFEAWLDSRVDLDPTSRSAYTSHGLRILPVFGRRDPFTITQEDVQAWVKLQMDGPPGMKPLKPASIRAYMMTARQVFAYAGVEPNPAIGVKRPKIAKSVPNILTRDEFYRVLAQLADKNVLLFRILEATGLRISEPWELTWAAVDWQHNRLLFTDTKSDGALFFADVPEPLMMLLAQHAPIEEQLPSKRIFADIPSPGAAAAAWARACEAAGVEHTNPHALRHRRISLWHKQGMAPVDIAYRVGHEDWTTHQKKYTHVILDAADDEWWTP